MIILDTNVVSEVTHLAPDRAVGRWIRDVPHDRLCVTATVVAESLVGLGIMPDGQRKRLLAARIDAIFDSLVDGRIMPFDAEAARAYAVLRTGRRRAGRPMSMGDAQIAGVCLAHDAALATRNTRDFAGCGIRLINPWEHGAGGE